RFFSERPHIAGSKRQEELADELVKRWNDYGFDKVEKVKYDVLLSYPDPDKPNTVKLMNADGRVNYTCSGQEKVRDAAENDTLVVRAVLGYAPNGTVEEQLIYVNFGRVEDFERLRDELGVVIQGRIAIMRYGKIFRGDKVANAARFGAKGAIIFSDPQQYAPEGTTPDKVYPNGEWLPPTGVQRGSIYTALGAGVGDPQTPALPSIEGIYRRPLNESELPTIPAQPISYGDAIHFLRNMGGNKAPDDWQGDLPITYNLGPGFTPQSNLQNNIKMELHNHIEVKSIYNVIGTIYGREEPDRYVLMGNHRDSWVFGAVDAGTGTGTTNEVARVLGKLKRTGWTPRRTVKMCSWAAEEYSNIGSREWVEEHRKILDKRAVAYLNCDMAVGGSFAMRARATPLLKGLIWKWMSKVTDPTDPNNNIFDVMIKRLPPNKMDPGKPNVQVLTSVSDFAHFYHHMGIPSTDMTYQYGYKGKMSSYPVYHSQHDTYKWASTFMDPGFVIHKAMGQLLGGMLLELADTPLLPMDVRLYADVINKTLTVLKTIEGVTLAQRGITLEFLEKAVAKFSESARAFDNVRSSVEKNQDKESFPVLRRLNNQMVEVDKAFVYPYGLPGRPLTRHVAFAPERYNAYGSSSFPGVSDAIFDAKRGHGSWDEVEKQISIVMQSALSAAEVLKIDGEARTIKLE
ncbi:predicted protein, partial [Nematostella vectensis]